MAELIFVLTTGLEGEDVVAVVVGRVVEGDVVVDIVVVGDVVVVVVGGNVVVVREIVVDGDVVLVVVVVVIVVVEVAVLGFLVKLSDVITRAFAKSWGRTN